MDILIAYIVVSLYTCIYIFHTNKFKFENGGTLWYLRFASRSFGAHISPIFKKMSITIFLMAHLLRELLIGDWQGLSKIL